MSVITISRQMASLGNEIASEVAERLGWQRVCRNLINQAARAAGVPQVALAEIDELGFLGLHPSTKEWQAYQNQVKTIVLQLAGEGNVVIVGRGGQIILRDFPNALHLRVVAPLAVRATRLQQQERISAEAAYARLEASDKTRTRYLQRGYGVALNDPTLYHLVINTGWLAVPQAVDLILQTYRTVGSSNNSH